MNNQIYSLQVNYQDELDKFLRDSSQKYFFQLAEGKITQQEMKVEFSKEILSKMIFSLDLQKCTPENLKQHEALLSDNFVFLRTLYPQPKPSLVNKIIFSKINDMDELDKIECDLLSNLGINYDHTVDRESILNKSQKFFNEIIQSSQETFPAFTSLLMKQIPSKLSSKFVGQYDSIIKKSWKFQMNAEIAQTPEYKKELGMQKLKLNSRSLYRAIDTWVSSLEQILVDPQSHLLGRKYLKKQSSNQSRNKKQIAKSRIFKSPQPSRQILQEDVSQAQEDQQQPSLFSTFFNKLKDICKSRSDTEGFQTLDSFYINDMKSSVSSKELVGRTNCLTSEKYENYDFKNCGYLVKNFLQVLEDLEKDANFKGLKEDQLKHLRQCYMQTIKSVRKNNDNHRYTAEEKLVYSFCNNCYSFTEELILEKMVKLIESLLELKRQAGKDYKKNMVFQKIDLISFSVPNLISARMCASQDLILQVYSVLDQMMKRREIKFCRINNKLMEAQKQLQIILKIKANPVLCSLKLVLEDQQGINKEAGPETRLAALNSMNSFFRSVQTSSFGSFSYLATTIFCNDHRALYLNKIQSSSHQTSHLTKSSICYCGKPIIQDNSYFLFFQRQVKDIINEEGRINLEGYRRMIPKSFVCGVCQSVIKKGDTLIPVVHCRDCGFKICPDCSFQLNPEIQKKIFVSLINSVVRISDNFFYSQLEIRDPIKMNYNHQYNRTSNFLVEGQLQERKETYYNIILQGKGFLRCKSQDFHQEFILNIQQNIELKNFTEYRNIIDKRENNVGILFRPSELMKTKGNPFIFLSFDSQDKHFFQIYCPIWDGECSSDAYPTI